MQYDDYTREGWSRRGVRSRLDRRRSLKEAIKRRAVQAHAPPFTNDDLRYRQLALRRRPATEAVVYFAMDVSSSMTEDDRKLAKTFFFWVVQGLAAAIHASRSRCSSRTRSRRGSSRSNEFFQVSGSGGTVASTAFRKVLEIAAQRYDPSRFNTYVFYASDGANFHHDREAAQAALSELGGLANYVGYVETTSSAQHALQLRNGAAVRAARSGDGRRGAPRAVARRSPCGTRFARSSRAASERRGVA